MITQEEHEKRLALYNLGLADREIGEKMFLSTSTISYWRIKHGLPANHRHGRIVTADMQEDRMMLYRHGLSDLRIAEELGLTRSGISSWRNRCGLPNKKERKQNEQNK